MRFAEYPHRIFIPLAVLAILLVGCGVKIRSMGSLGGMTFALLDDNGNNLLWNSVDLVKGNKLDPTFSGKCGPKVSQVQVYEGGILKKTTSCSGGSFSLSMTGGNAFVNGVHHLSLMTVPPSSTLSKTYDLFRVDPTTMVSFDAFPAITGYSSEPFSGVCNFALSISLNGTAVDCASAQAFNQSIPIALGANVINVTWIDVYGNSGYRDFTITRNPAGAPDVQFGMLSATDSSEVLLTNCVGLCGASAPTLSLHQVTGTGAGTVSQAIPLALSPASGANGLTLSVTNQSYSFCENQDGSGNCTP